jgi:hypothetical protein
VRLRAISASNPFGRLVDVDPRRAVALAPRGSETGRCLSVAGYVAGPGPRGAAIAAGGCPEGANVGYSLLGTAAITSIELPLGARIVAASQAPAAVPAPGGLLLLMAGLAFASVWRRVSIGPRA